jgi:chromosome partitioning protein
MKLVETMQAIKKDHGLKADIAGILPTFYDEVTRESQATLQDLKDRFPKHVLTPIHRTTVLRECSAYGRTIYEMDDTSRAAKEYYELVDHILRIS